MLKKILLPILLLFPLGAGANLIGVVSENKEPIEITADKLEVFQEESRAVFSGNVIVIKGEMVMKANMMNVFYAPSENQTSQPESGSFGSSIKKIIAKGNLFVTNKLETISGDKGVYEASTDIINITGDVVLTKEKNIIKGSHLTYDMKTGKSKIIGGDNNKNRVRGLFVPEDSK